MERNRGVDQLADRRIHNPKVPGSNPGSAPISTAKTRKRERRRMRREFLAYARKYGLDPATEIADVRAAIVLARRCGLYFPEPPEAHG